MVLTTNHSKRIKPGSTVANGVLVSTVDHTDTEQDEPDRDDAHHHLEIEPEVGEQEISIGDGL